MSKLHYAVCLQLLISYVAQAREVICMRLRPGEQATIDYDSNDSPSGVPLAYRMKRNGEHHYEIELNLHYHAGTDFDGAIPEAGIDKFYRSRAASCFAELREVLVSGDDSIDLVVAERGHRHEIGIRKKGFRSNSENLAWDDGCATMLHETLHLLGLVDEYSSGETDGVSLENGKFHYVNSSHADFPYTCRVKGAYDSVMADQFRALGNTALTEDVEVTQCNCDPGVDCEALAAATTGNACPLRTKVSTGHQMLLAGAKINRVVTPAFFVLPEAPSVRSAATHFQSSALKVSHFLAITEPGCDLNHCYYACAKNAYRFETPPAIAPGISHPSRGCLPIPADCHAEVGYCFR